MSVTHNEKTPASPFMMPVPLFMSMPVMQAALMQQQQQQQGLSSAAANSTKALAAQAQTGPMPSLKSSPRVGYYADQSSQSNSLSRKLPPPALLSSGNSQTPAPSSKLAQPSAQPGQMAANPMVPLTAPQMMQWMPMSMPIGMGMGIGIPSAMPVGMIGMKMPQSSSQNG